MAKYPGIQGPGSQAAEEALKQVMEQYPTLTDYGFGLVLWNKSDTYEEKFQQYREELAQSGGSFESLAPLFQEIRPIKSINKNRSSYGLKHLAEFWVGAYCTNGVFIAAALHAGFRFQRMPHGGPNVMFNMSEKDLNRLDNEWRRKNFVVHLDR